MAEDNEESGEKEFEASEQKRAKARQDGNIAQSKEINGLAVLVGLLLVSGIWTAGVGESVFEQFASVFRHADGFSNDLFTGNGRNTFGWLTKLTVTLSPILLVPMICVMVMIAATRTFTVSLKKIKPDLKKISPVDNTKKKYGSQGLIDFLKDAAKMFAAGFIASIYLVQFAESYYASSAISAAQLGAFTFSQIMKIVLAFFIFQLFLAAIDYPVQLRLHSNRLKMTREDMKKEAKQSEGDPHVKQQRRQKASQISSGKMLQNVPQSTVIMVNPEHYAVALKWDPEGASAPTVVAKGLDHLAEKIREIAKAHGIPIYRDPPSTRAIYSLVEIDQEIHPEHFAAVAAAIQFAHSLKLRT